MDSDAPSTSQPTPSRPTRQNPSTSTAQFFDWKSQVSEAKHRVLSNYLGAWFPILSQNRYRVANGEPQYTKLVYVDGFAGPGIYENGEHGSPVIAYKVALDHKIVDPKGPEIHLIFIEKLKNSSDKLLENLKRVKQENIESPNANIIKFMVIRGKFVESMQWILSKEFSFPTNFEEKVFRIPNEQEQQPLTEKYIGTQTPLLVFIDPFGYSGKNIPMSLMRSILSESSKSEILVNLMTGFLGRFFKVKSREQAYNLLLGDDEYDDSWKPIILQKEDMKSKLETFLKYYKAQLQQNIPQNLYACLFEMACFHKTYYY